jgi:hypothetical protein
MQNSPMKTTSYLQEQVMHHHFIARRWQHHQSSSVLCYCALPSISLLVAGRTTKVAQCHAIVLAVNQPAR